MKFRSEKIFATALAVICLCAICLLAVSCEPAHHHSYVLGKSVPATCTKAGYDEYFCVECLNTKQKKTDSPLGHSFTNYVSDGNATCTKDGTKTAVCNRPECFETNTVTDLGSKHHNYVGGKCTYCGCLSTSFELSYRLSADKSYYAVVGIGMCSDIDIVIPKEYNGKPVKEIGAGAFKNCSYLTSIYISKNVTIIGSDAFYHCSGVESIQVESGNTTYHSAGNCLIKTENKTLILGCKNSVIPNDGSVTAIGSSAFRNCSSLASVTIPNRVTTIGDFAFQDCTSLTSVIIGNGVTTIGDYAFDSCRSLTKVNYTGTIDQWVSISFSSSNANPLSYAHDLYINNEKVTNAVLTTATKISNYAFRSCKSLTSVTIGSGVTTIGGSAFSYCDSLTSVTIPDSVTEIGSSAFNGCTSLTSVTIGNSVTMIGEEAFRSCTSLTSVTIGNSVTEIGRRAFASCTSLTSVTIGDSVTTIGSSAFEYCYKLVEVYNLSRLNITKGSYDNGYIGYYAKDIYTSQSSPSKLSTDANGYILYTNGSEKILMGYTGTATELTLPSGITEINQYAFYGNDSITSIVIPNSVTTIGDDAFYYCTSLTSVTIGNSVTMIGECAFCFCKSLKNIAFNGTTEQWNAIYKKSQWDDQTGSYSVHCTNGSINK